MASRATFACRDSFSTILCTTTLAILGIRCRSGESVKGNEKEEREEKGKGERKRRQEMEERRMGRECEKTTKEIKGVGKEGMERKCARVESVYIGRLISLSSLCNKLNPGKDHKITVDIKDANCRKHALLKED